MFAYEQCLLCLAYHPDIWIEAAAYLEQSSKILTEKGVSVITDSHIKLYYRVITLISVNIIPSLDIEGCKLESVRR